MTRTVAWSALLALAVAGRPAPTRAAEAFTLANVTRQLRPQYPQIQPLADVLPPGVTAQEDVTYARAGDTALALDLYRPAGDAPFPAVLLVHAGGWDSGSREMERPFAKRLAGLGYVAVPVSYRLGPVARFPDPLHDLKAAVRWLRAHAAEHGVDPARIGVIGMSAGGQLAALLGATNGQADFEGDVGERGVSSAVQAVVDIDGLADFTGAELVAQQERSPSAPTRYLGGKFSERPDTWRAASALTHVGPRSAPTFFINSTAPTPILPGREAMRDRLHAAGVASELTVVPGTPHPFWLFQPWFEPTLAAADTFLRVHLAPAERTAPLTWRWSNPTPHGANIVDVAHVNGLAVQVGERGQIFTSTDFEYWTPRDSHTTRSLRGVTFLGGRIVISGESGTILFADDPTEFFLNNLATTDWLESVAASTNLVVAVGDNGAVYTSSNAVSWTRRTTADATRQSAR